LRGAGRNHVSVISGGHETFREGREIEKIWGGEVNGGRHMWRTLGHGGRGWLGKEGGGLVGYGIGSGGEG